VGRCIARQRAGLAEKLDPMLGRELPRPRHPRPRSAAQVAAGQLGTLRGLARRDHTGREVTWCADRERLPAPFATL